MSAPSPVIWIANLNAVRYLLDPSDLSTKRAFRHQAPYIAFWAQPWRLTIYAPFAEICALPFAFETQTTQYAIIASACSLLFEPHCIQRDRALLIRAGLRLQNRTVHHSLAPQPKKRLADLQRNANAKCQKRARRAKPNAGQLKAVSPSKKAESSLRARQPNSLVSRGGRW
jgi:hypothetical protein